MMLAAILAQAAPATVPPVPIASASSVVSSDRTNCPIAPSGGTAADAAKAPRLGQNGEAAAYAMRQANIHNPNCKGPSAK